MPSSVAIYRLKDFVRITEKGDIDLERSKQIVHELAAAASFHQAHSILVDLRGSTERHTIGDHMELALDLARYRSVFTGRMAFIFPNDPDRLSLARGFLACLDMVGYRFQVEIFTSFENAIDWLADKAPGRPESSPT